jgi:hypothetical protein
MDTIPERDYRFVTNNRLGLLAPYSRAPVHAGLVIIVPNVTLLRQRELFQAALGHTGKSETVNAVLAVEHHGDRIECREYPLPMKRLRLVLTFLEPESTLSSARQPQAGGS